MAVLSALSQSVNVHAAHTGMAEGKSPSPFLDEEALVTAMRQAMQQSTEVNIRAQSLRGESVSGNELRDLEAHIFALEQFFEKLNVAQAYRGEQRIRLLSIQLESFKSLNQARKLLDSVSEGTKEGMNIDASPEPKKQEGRAIASRLLHMLAGTMPHDAGKALIEAGKCFSAENGAFGGISLTSLARLLEQRNITTAADLLCIDLRQALDICQHIKQHCISASSAPPERAHQDSSSPAANLPLVSLIDRGVVAYDPAHVLGYVILCSTHAARV